MKNILVLCTGNSCRSQMAHGFLNHLKNQPSTNIYSAGIETHGLNKDAVRTMADFGVDISTHTSNHIHEYEGIEFDLILTVCDHAQENCPYFPSKAIRLHHNFSDPSKLQGTESEQTIAFKNTATEIRNYVIQLINEYQL